MKIQSIKAREILDSRGYPTVEVDLMLDSGHLGRMMVPSGASTGVFEAWELRDGDLDRFQGKGVLQAVRHVNEIIAPELIGKQVTDQELIDQTMIKLDGTANKSRLGANAILGVSFAAAHAAASVSKLPLYRYLANKYTDDPGNMAIPMPMINIISGGLHAGKKIDLQDFLIIPIGADAYPKCIEMVSSVYWKMKQILSATGYVADLLADEGGFGPSLASNEMALDLLTQAIEEAGWRPGEDIAIALDVASSHFYDSEAGVYRLNSEDRDLSQGQMVDLLESWVKKYPIISIEDGLSEDDWEGWIELTKRLGHKVELVGDDFFTTNPERIRKGIELNAGNSVLIKMNQIGTLTETVQAVAMAKKAGFRTVISARSGETEDHTLADLAVGLQGGQIKIGSLARSSRLSKYNQLLRINEDIQRLRK